MDIILEIWDTFIGDRLYSSLLPASLSSSVSFPAFVNAANSSLALFGAAEPFVYEQATQMIYLEPSKYAYLSVWPRNNMYRQFTSFFLITWIFGLLVYFVVASLSYVFIWDKTTYNHPKFLKNQIRLEIKQAMGAMPPMALLTAPFFVLEVRGYAKLYDTAAEEPFPFYSLIQFPFFICFTDFFIYWIHRGLHHPRVYKTLHKPHHKWIMPSPYASHAFHPLDGWSQSVPYHVFPFLFPPAEDGLRLPVRIYQPLDRLYSRRRFTTFWDRLGGSYRKPNEELFRRETKMGDKEWQRQAKEMETILKDVEGEDDRSYSSDKKKNL
ncbi:hypothetical protein N7499_008595 [Penicillium canescens]|nr:hypothetical protein N7499_008595 [Penicillium canescens]